MMRLFAVLLIVLLSFETVSYARNNSMNVAARRVVQMKGKKHESGGSNSQRFPTFCPILAFVDGSNLQLEFRKLPCTVEVSIVNAQTDELVYSEFCIATDNVVISLDELKRGEYRLEVSLDENTILLYGDFVF